MWLIFFECQADTQVLLDTSIYHKTVVRVVAVVIVVVVRVVAVVVVVVVVIPYIVHVFYFSSLTAFADSSEALVLR